MVCSYFKLRISHDVCIISCKWHWGPFFFFCSDSLSWTVVSHSQSAKKPQIRIVFAACSHSRLTDAHWWTNIGQQAACHLRVSWPLGWNISLLILVDCSVCGKMARGPRFILQAGLCFSPDLSSLIRQTIIQFGLICEEATWTTVLAATKIRSDQKLDIQQVTSGYRATCLCETGLLRMATSSAPKRHAYIHVKAL